MSMSWLVITLNSFKCSTPEAPSFILVLYNFFIRNTLFVVMFFSYKSCNYFHRLSAVFSSSTLNYTFFARYCRIVVMAFLSIFFQSSSSIIEGFFATPAIGKHWSLRIDIFSIWYFHREKLSPLSFSISLITVSILLANLATKNRSFDTSC